MNHFIEIMNLRGGQLLDFAWLMLWQSSLLIILVFVLDFGLARKLRASVRYTLWLAVLVKLLLPPTLALPTGAAWWLFPSKTAAVGAKYAVTYDHSSLPVEVTSEATLPAPVFVPKLKWEAWALTASLVVGLGLLLWLSVRWWQVSRMVRQTAEAPGLDGLLAEAAKLAGVRTSVRLKITEGRMSPAVCGLFRPVILLPQTLLEKLSPTQLRAVLLHELFHLRRWDVRVNCAQALLQIAYWWHPLLWLANARVRRVREEAVDDAVMLALCEEAEGYAPTLLEVAKLAFHRPLVSLGLVGIMESRSALRQRIERLMDYHAPRRAGLTVGALLGIVAFSAVALPMGEAPAPAGGQNVADASTGSEPVAATDRVPILVTTHFYWMTPDQLNRLTSGLAPIPGADNSGGYWPVPAAEFSRLKADLIKSGLRPVSSPRIQTFTGEPAEMYVGNETNSIDFTCTPTLSAQPMSINLAIHGRIVDTRLHDTAMTQFKINFPVEDGGGFMARMGKDDGLSASNLVAVFDARVITNLSLRYGQRLEPAVSAETSERNATVAKLNQVRLAALDYDHRPLVEVVRQLNEAIKQADPTGKGLRLWIAPHHEGAASLMVNPATGLPQDSAIDPATGLPESSAVNAGAVLITVNPPLKNVRLGDAVNAIITGAAQPIQYEVGADGGIIFAPSLASPALFTRTYNLDTNVFLTNLRRETGVADFNSAQDPSKAINHALLKLFAAAGADFKSPPGGIIFYNGNAGQLMVRATRQELDIIEPILSALGNARPVVQIHIKARFLEVPQGAVVDMNDLLATTNLTIRGMTGILQQANSRSVMHSLMAQSGFTLLAEPEVTTTSGSQTQMRATQLIEVVTNMMLEENLTNHQNEVAAGTEKFELGPIFDVTPRSLPDGYTLDMQMTASVSQFWGYAKVPKNEVARYVTNSVGEVIPLANVWPAMERYSQSAHLTLRDGQTVVMTMTPPQQIHFGPTDEKREAVVAKHILDGKKSEGEKAILVLVTATLVDAAGNRIHSDSDLASVMQSQATSEDP